MLNLESRVMNKVHKVLICLSVMSCALVMAGPAGARVIRDTGASDAYFKVNGKRVATEFDATRAAMANNDIQVEKCTPQKGTLETADGRPAGAAFKCSEVELHETTKGKPSWKRK